MWSAAGHQGLSAWGLAQGPFTMRDMRAWLRSGYLKSTNWVVHVDDRKQEWMLKDVLAAQRVYPEAWLTDPGRPRVSSIFLAHSMGFAAASAWLCKGCASAPILWHTVYWYIVHWA